jgi:hypothetical protein
MSAPITVDEMAGLVRRAIERGLFGAGVTETPQGAAFEMTTPATGQRFRVTVAEVSPWSDQVDRELREATREEGAQ